MNACMHASCGMHSMSQASSRKHSPVTSNSQIQHLNEAARLSFVRGFKKLDLQPYPPTFLVTDTSTDVPSAPENSRAASSGLL